MTRPSFTCRKCSRKGYVPKDATPDDLRKLACECGERVMRSGAALALERYREQQALEAERLAASPEPPRLYEFTCAGCLKPQKRQASPIVFEPGDPPERIEFCDMGCHQKMVDRKLKEHKAAQRKAKA